MEFQVKEYDGTTVIAEDLPEFSFSMPYINIRISSPFMLSIFPFRFFSTSVELSYGFPSVINRIAFSEEVKTDKIHI